MGKESRAQIVATVGPASGTVELLTKLLEVGMDVARLNFSWGTYEEHAAYILNAREAAKALGREVKIIQDLSGPRMKTDTGHGIDSEKAKVNVITEKDLKDLDFGIAQNVDYVALSYVGDASDVEELRREVRKRSGAQKIIAKIERVEAIENFDEILKAADAIMVARGDLGEEIPLETIPFVQRDLIQKCNAAGKPVITATQMMLSMVENNKPTRAEVTDVAFAIMCGSDAVMLSEESARGKYPVEAVRAMERIIAEAERRLPPIHPTNLL